ncbi:hypothetical protein CkaCkLH20_11895 [Colletotrichum karsti]|uniref:BZIP domain-containing protein n=1 Tax=Colletotrichum karsti TaxID=1095194 RepID=A0A9P6HUH4_9PEZI|nr:uncharacterized protein CkaCkLH20_11895 [Colletotrichum karsti]KAF9870589.1 hypothetical protein CkaCkLH20_11895 [Colletotrichum karsti]
MQPDEDSQASSNRTRKSRRTSDLTGTQIARKRAMDRSNQRTHRAKNKATIAVLENKLAELTFQLNEAKTQLAKQDEIIRSFGMGANDGFSQDTTTLPSVASLGGPPGAELPRSTASLGEQSGSGTHGVETSRHYDICDETLALDPRQDVFNPFTDIDKCFDDWAFELDFGAQTDFFNQDMFNFLIGARPDSPDQQKALRKGMTETDPEFNSDERSPERSIGSPFQAQEELSEKNTPWRLIPPNLPPKTPLDKIIVNSSRRGRKLFLQTRGRRRTELSEPCFPSISPLVNRTPSDGVPRPLSDELAAQVQGSPFKFLVERLAFMYKLSHLIRWLMCQTKETYEAMPTYMRPTQLQLTVPHPAWIDAITWPGARDEIITKMNWESEFNLFQRLTGQTVSVNWPYPDSGAFMESSDGQVLTLHPLFEAHVRQEENWTCGQEVGAAFAFMRSYSTK